MVHAFRMGGLRLTLDVESGALHVLDEAAFSVLENILDEKDDSPRDVSPEETHHILNEFDALKKAGQLFTPSAEARVHGYMNDRRPVIKALCLHMAHECNLKCKYCFAGQGNYGKNDRGLMSFETGKKALDFIVAQSGSRRNLEIDFFGGEPMLNFVTVKALVAYGRGLETETGKRFRFTLTTNGTLLNDENIPYINETFDNIVLSLDGRPEVNDRMRGEGTSAQIEQKLKKMSEARGDTAHYIRGTFTRYNLDFAADVLYLADRGFKYISVEPVVAPPETEYALREEDLPVLFTEYEKLADALLERESEGNGIKFFHFEIDPEGGPCIAKRVTGCGAGAEYLAVTPAGRLFPCHQFVGDDAFCLGDLDTGICDNAAKQGFSQCHVFNKPVCTECWAKYYCSGGCMATAHYANGSIFIPDKISCALMRKRIECALYMAAKRKI
ncbi:MAG: thioether cross-link-forming SCIFF peptide maturase [Defluviitaleaceae bacterium]|nr:thioether cross-link-forming SCIFF peptide maturase [Defluviitaleaceae bacterium]